MNPADILIGRLERVIGKGPRWRAMCPAHESKERHRSLGIREMDDGRVLIRCHARCSAVDVLAAIGLDLKDLFPTGPQMAYAPSLKRRNRDPETEYGIPGARAISNKLREERERSDRLLRRVALLSGINVSPVKRARGRHPITSIFAHDDPSTIAAHREKFARIPAPPITQDPPTRRQTNGSNTPVKDKRQQDDNRINQETNAGHHVPG